MHVDLDARSKDADGNWRVTCGSAYVALSRATRVEHVTVAKPLRLEHVRVDPEVAAHFSRR